MMSDKSFERREVFQEKIYDAETVPALLHVLGAEFRLASGNPTMRKFKEETGETAFDAYYEELYPLTDGDIDYVMGKLAWQAARVASTIPKLPFSRYREARDLVAKDVKSQRYVNRAKDAAWKAHKSARYLYDLVESDTQMEANSFINSVRRLGLPNNGMELRAMCNFVLSCKPSYLDSGRLRLPGGATRLDDYTRLWLGSFGHATVKLLRTWVPVS